jgi:hypothetical protein
MAIPISLILRDLLNNKPLIDKNIGEAMGL